MLPTTKISFPAELKATPSPMSAIPVPPSRVENTNCEAAGCDGFNSDTNAVTGTVTAPSSKIPLLLFVPWHLLAVVGKVLAYEVSNADAEVVSPVT